jgi:hypothetical protein
VEHRSNGVQRHAGKSREAGAAHPIGHDLGWPLLGLAHTLADNLDGARTWSADPLADLVCRAFVLTMAVGLVGFCAALALRLRACCAARRRVVRRSAGP